ncbi:hypothetical protein [Brachybacterium sp. GPGPB12]|uniref:hypothetical protein n=1 Tax=Brachybacterium sp. GPGPB12 TaxID=3023517 RepID=UPI00313432C2
MEGRARPRRAPLIPGGPARRTVPSPAADAFPSAAGLGHTLCHERTEHTHRRRPRRRRSRARALAEQGITTVDQLVGRDWAELAESHGVGPASGRRSQALLLEHGEGMTNPPAPARGRSTVTRGSSGKSAKDIKTHTTSVDPADYVDGLEGRRREEERGRWSSSAAPPASRPRCGVRA